MGIITYNSVSELAQKIKSELKEAEFKQLIKELVNNNLAEFQEYRQDTVAAGNYAPIVKTCIACGRPV
ncbi:MAG: hypothetical protein ACK5RT_16915 [Dolichospermum sp.]|jgi:hypothetical protein